MKWFYMPKGKHIEISKRVAIHQNSWFLLFPNICLYGYGFEGGFSKLCSIQIEWMYWALTLQLVIE